MFIMLFIVIAFIIAAVGFLVTVAGMLLIAKDVIQGSIQQMLANRKNGGNKSK